MIASDLSRHRVLSLILLFALPGCNSGSHGSDGGPDTSFGPFTRPLQSSPTLGTLDLPVLIGFDESRGTDTVCAGQIIVLRGLNFSPDLNQNVVTFTSGAIAIRAAPTAVTFPVDNNTADGRNSWLSVVVPTGAKTGSVQLFVNGIFANQLGIAVCPMIVGTEVGVNRDAHALIHTPPLGFDPQFGPDTVWLHGLNFEDVTEVVVEGSDGRRFRIGPQVFRRPRLEPANGLESLRFSLQNAKMNVREPRDNLRVWVVAGDVQSNEVTVAVQPNGSQDRPLGATINGVELPWGVRTGSVRMRYSIYDRPVTMSYSMLFEWTVDGGQNWFPARLKTDDSEADGTQPELPGVVLPGSLTASDSALLRGGGGTRTFTWDAVHDEAFRKLNRSSGVEGNPAPRHWAVSFRISALPAFLDDSGDRFPSGVLFVTPPVAYFDVQDRQSGDAVDLRQGSFVEDFGASVNREDRLTTAIWGPPINRGTLEGRLEDRFTSQFGEGTAKLVLETDPEVPEGFIRELYEIDTTRMQISHVTVISDPDLDEIEVATVVFPTAEDANPGEDVFEFHLKSLTVTPGMPVRTRGSNPLVLRLSGADDPDAATFLLGGIIDADGNDGGAPGPPVDRSNCAPVASVCSDRDREGTVRRYCSVPTVSRRPRMRRTGACEAAREVRRPRPSIRIPPLNATRVSTVRPGVAAGAGDGVATATAGVPRRRPFRVLAEGRAVCNEDRSTRIRSQPGAEGAVEERLSLATMASSERSGAVAAGAAAVRFT